MRAGVARVDLTPEVGVPLGGYPYFERHNTGARDPLSGTALYLENTAGSAVLIVTTDLLWITRRQGDAIRAGISHRTGVDVERILVTASHSHSAPKMCSIFETLPGDEVRAEPEFDTDYVDAVVEACIDLASRAHATAFDAEVGYTKVSCGAESGIGGNRRNPSDGPIDPELPVLAVRDSDGTLRAIWTKYALHPTILHGENTLVSADFPGAMRVTVETTHPDALFLYSMGTAGDQSPRYFCTGQTFDEVDRFGRVLGSAVLRGVDRITWTDDVPLSVASRVVELVVKRYPELPVLRDRVERLREKERALIAADASYVERQTANLWLLGAKCDYVNASRLASGTLMDRYAACAPYEVTALTVGDVAWVFLPGEIFCEFGLAVKERSPIRETNVVTMTNGDLPGYCVTHDALAVGGYEVGNSILDPRSGDVLTGTAIDLLNSLVASREGAH